MTPMAIPIAHTRTCDCPPNHLNCLTPKEWLRNQIGVWQFSYTGQDIRDKTLHPAVFPLSLAAQVIKLFTHRGELVIDPFVGSGTTLVAARDLDRNAIGADISQKYVDLAQYRLGMIGGENSEQMAIVSDARNLPEVIPHESAQLIFTSPPYADMLNHPRVNKSRRGKEQRNAQYSKVEQYSQDGRDLGILDQQACGQAIGKICKGLMPALRAGGHAVINIGDPWQTGGRIPLHAIVIEAMVEAGYLYRNVVIWDKTNLMNRVNILGWPSRYITLGGTYEYILHFQKSDEEI